MRRALLAPYGVTSRHAIAVLTRPVYISHETGGGKGPDIPPTGSSSACHRRTANLGGNKEICGIGPVGAKCLGRGSVSSTVPESRSVRVLTAPSFMTVLLYRCPVLSVALVTRGSSSQAVRGGRGRDGRVGQAARLLHQRGQLPGTCGVCSVQCAVYARLRVQTKSQLLVCSTS